MEQFIRASQAERLGLVRMLDSRNYMEPQVMAEALKALPSQSEPGMSVVPGLLDGLGNISKLLDQWLAEDNVTAVVTGIHS